MNRKFLIFILSVSLTTAELFDLSGTLKNRLFYGQMLQTFLNSHPKPDILDFSLSAFQRKASTFFFKFNFIPVSEDTDSIKTLEDQSRYLEKYNLDTQKCEIEEYSTENQDGVVGDTCGYEFDCLDLNASCKDGTCHCNPGYYTRDKKCYKQSSKRLDERCFHDEGCMSEFSECLNKKCVCKEGYAGHNNVCYELTNASCTKPNDCLLISKDANKHDTQIEKPNHN